VADVSIEALVLCSVFGVGCCNAWHYTLYVAIAEGLKERSLNDSDE
jgi:hypothetical protein